MTVKELMELANIKELKEGPVYVMLLPDDLPVDVDAREMFEPADVRIVQVPDVSQVKIFELKGDPKPQKCTEDPNTCEHSYCTFPRCMNEEAYNAKDR